MTAFVYLPFQLNFQSKILCLTFLIRHLIGACISIWLKEQLKTWKDLDELQTRTFFVLILCFVLLNIKLNYCEWCWLAAGWFHFAFNWKFAGCNCNCSTQHKKTNFFFYFCFIVLFMFYINETFVYSADCAILLFILFVRESIISDINPISHWLITMNRIFQHKTYNFEQKQKKVKRVNI